MKTSQEIKALFNELPIRVQNSFNAAIIGTNEVIRPLISSVLTTIAVFVPLISLSGIAGAIFFDQAITITISLFVSLIASIMVIPVLYRLFIRKNRSGFQHNTGVWMLAIYEKMIHLIMKKKTLSFFGFFMLIPLGLLLFYVVKKEKFPELQQTDIIASIDWNEPVSLVVNKSRAMEILHKMHPHQQSSSAYIGKIHFALTENRKQSFNFAKLYLDFGHIIDVNKVSLNFKNILKGSTRMQASPLHLPKICFMPFSI